MTSYAALLRGIAPLNPNMQNAKLRAVFESLRLANVRTVISSGNVLFESATTDVPALEAKIERALLDQLGLTGTTTIIRSRAELQALIGRDPFAGRTHSNQTYLTVTFAKTPLQLDITFPYQPPDRGYTLVAGTPHEICAVTDITAAKTPDLMAWLERKFGKDITTRTYKTVERILAKL